MKKDTSVEKNNKKSNGDNNFKKQEDVVINTSNGIGDGQLKCPGCGASEIQPNPKTGKLRCSYCFTEFDGNKINNVTDLSSLNGRIIGSGASNIKADYDDVITLKCGGCGAEVVIDTANAPHARCHWCRSILSINSQIENGTNPDVILPFKVSREDARAKISDFVTKRKFFANPTFRKEFTTENIMGVYFPYMLVDANCHAKFDGVGEHLIRTYTVKHGDTSETRYDADSYSVSREFDITIDDLEVESNSVRMDKTNSELTNNVINSIMPFDTENCIQYVSNYLVGYTSERRDVNIDDLDEKVQKQFKDVCKFSINPDLKFYDRGIRWEKQDVQVKGTQWISAYLPVWLYSYQEVKGNKKTLHYVAVNARTLETMGSVPINMPLLFMISAIIEIVALFLSFMIVGSSGDDDSYIFVVLALISGFAYFGLMFARYRNQSARHSYEKETKNTISNLVKHDSLIKRNNGLSSSVIDGKNNETIEGDKIPLFYRKR